MSAVDSVRTCMLALESREFATAATYLSEDFSFSGWTPRPLDKNQFMSVMEGLKEGMPNLTYNFHVVQAERGRLELDAQVQGVVQITGSQTDSFILPALGLPPVPQLGRSVSLPEERWNYTVQREKIFKIAVERLEGGGLSGLLQQLGFNAPIIQ